MGFIFGLIKKLLKTFIYFLIFSAIIVLIPNLPPYTSFSKIELDPIPPQVGPLAINNELNNVEKLYTNKLLGPEAFELYKGEVYTSLATGEIVKISPGGHVTFVTKIGQPCMGLKQEQLCGRPLGFSIDEKNNQIYIADAYYGIWKVDLKTDKKQLLVSPRVEIDGRVPKLFNSVTLDSNGNLYWTDSSSDFHLKDGAYTLLTDPSGRLFSYNAAKNESKVLVDNLWFANGITVSPDNQFIVIAETCAMRLRKYYINGPKKGQSEVMATLPGTPDNIRALPDGSGVLVSLYMAASADQPMMLHSLAAAPLARKFLARLFRLIEIPFEFLYHQYPHYLFEDITYYIGHFRSLSPTATQVTGLVHLDWNGNVIASYYNTKDLTHISDAIVYNDKLYLGKPHEQNFIAAVPVPAGLKKAFSFSKSEPAKPKVVEKKEVPKTVKSTEAPKPTPAPKPTQPPKPVDPVKVETPKPAQVKPNVQKETVKPTPQPPKPTPQPPKPTTQPPKPTPQPTKPTAPPTKADTKQAPKAQEKKETPKPVAQEAPKTTPPTKAESAKTKPAVKVYSTTPRPQTKATQPDSSKTTKKPDTTPPPPKVKEEKVKPSQQKQAQTDTPKKKAPEPTPIKEEIPSDTIKPNHETLKVIKKDGPTEIPNPKL